MQGLLYEVAKKISEKTNKYERFLQEVHGKYDLRPFKIQKMTPSSAKKIYNGINAKYQRGQLQTLPTGWFQNQRRLFIWFAVCYQYVFNVNLLQVLFLINKDGDVWKKFSKVFHSKQPIFLQFQYRNLIKSKGRQKWQPQQDEYLRKAVKKEKPGQWNQISKEIFFDSDRLVFKTPKQCRERWFNHLDESKTKSEWSSLEDLKLLKYVLQNGTKWSKIVSHLDNKRTEHQIKNRFNSLTSNVFKGKMDENQQRNSFIEDLISSLQKTVMEQENNEIVEGEEMVKRELKQLVKEQQQQDKVQRSSSVQKKGSYTNCLDLQNFNSTGDLKYIGTSPIPFILRDCKSPSDYFTSPMPYFGRIHTPGGIFDETQFKHSFQQWKTMEFGQEDQKSFTQEIAKHQNTTELSMDYHKIFMQDHLGKKASFMEPPTPIIKLVPDKLLIKSSSLSIQAKQVQNQKVKRIQKKMSEYVESNKHQNNNQYQND